MKSQFIRQRSSTRWGLPINQRQSGRGQPHSTTSRQEWRAIWRDSVLECGCPLPLSFFSCPRVLFAALMVIHTSLAASTNDLTTALQKGLFEEEANRNFPAAIESYQSVINHFDEDRKLAATAIFRLGEIYRKQGKTNEANAQYERVVREFSDQSTLATLSQSYLATVTASTANASTVNPNSESAPTSDEAEEVRKIRAMIRDSPDLINAKDQSGDTRLHSAARQGHLVVARFLIESGADPNIKNSTEQTPLHYAALFGHKALIELYLDHGAHIQATDRDGNTAMHFAARNGFRSIVELLLARGADVNAKSKSGATPLHLAVASGFKSVAEFLLNHGSDANLSSSSAWDQMNHSYNGTPLHIAAAREDQALAEMLLAYHADPNATNSAGNTPLHIAAQDGSQKLAEFLLSSKAVVDPINTNGETPLDLAATHGQASTASLLLLHGADVNAANPVSKGPIGWTPLVYALSRGKKETAALLLKSNANPNVKTAYSIGSKWWPEGVTPLLGACGKPDPEAVALLLDSKADPNLKSDAGLTPTVVVMNGSDPSDRKRMLSLLLDHGADTEARSEDGRTLLMHAVERRDKDLVNLLLAHKANPNAKNPSGFTPLHFVALALNGNTYPVDTLPEIAEALLTAGADVNLQDGGGRTALNRLTNPGTPVVFSGPPRDNVIKILQAHGAISDLPRLDAIEVRRSEGNYSKAIFSQGTNGWDQFTLFDLIGVQYNLLTASPSGEGRVVSAPYSNFAHNSGLDFPDFTRIRIRRPKPDFKAWSEQTIDIAPALASGDCSADVMLEPGDEVEIPEADHIRYATWNGLSKETLESLKKCLTRRISVVVKGQSSEITLAPEISFYNVSVQKGGQVVQQLKTNLKQFAPFMIVPVLTNSKLLLASSDLSRIKLIRTDPATGQKRELIVDCSEGKPFPSVWLRDGDVIEVPDKP